jgi:hypothetical protein
MSIQRAFGWVARVNQAGTDRQGAKHTNTLKANRTRVGKRLKLCVGVRADFAVQINFFVLRCGPFHFGPLLNGIK